MNYKKTIFGIFVVVVLLPHISLAATQVPSIDQCKAGEGSGLAAAGGTTFTYDEKANTCTITIVDTSGLVKPTITVVQYDAQGNPTSSTLNPTIGSPVTTTDVKTAPSGTCSVFSPGEWFQSCIWFPLMSWLGSWFLTLGGTLVRLTGALFDVLVQHVIISFGVTLTSLGINGVINDGWTIFRDLGNIIIIGIFVFIAISLIAGLKEFGQKHLIARVLLIAVFINFSLLMTRMIVDFSNFTAYQFYAASATSLGKNTNDFDIAKAFLEPMGITNVWYTQNLTDAAGRAAASSTTSGPSGWAAFFYGLIGGVMLIIIAGVLGYGCFMIAARAISIIVLMITGAIAFASHLIPSISDSEYGWKGWWKSLINSAIFAPILMIFLFISLKILSTANGAMKQKDGLSTFIGDPSAAISNSQTLWQTIFIYILTVGLLFASIKISGKFASGIGNGIVSGAINMAGAVATGGASLASRFAVAPLARRYVGGAAFASAEGKKKDAGAAVGRMNDLYSAGYTDEARGEARDALRLKRQADRRSRIADSKMNVMDTTPMKSLTSRFGLKGILSGQSSKETLSYAGKVKRDQDAISKLAESIRPNADDLRQKTRQGIYDKYAPEHAEKYAAKAAAETAYEAAKKEADMLGRKDGTATKDHQDRIIDAIRQMDGDEGVRQRYGGQLDTIKKFDDASSGWKQALNEAVKSVGQEQRAALEQQVGSSATADHLKSVEQQILQAVPEGMRSTVSQQLKESKGSHESDMRHESARIDAARKRAAELAGTDDIIKNHIGVAEFARLKRAADDEQKTNDDAVKMARDRANQTRVDLRNLVTNVRLEVQQAEKDVVKNIGEIMPLAAEVAAQEAAPWYRRGLIKTNTEQVAEKKLVEDLKKKAKVKLPQNVFAGYEERTGGDTTSTT